MAEITKITNSKVTLPKEVFLVDVKNHELLIFLDCCYSLVPKGCSIFNRKLFNIV